MTEPKKIAIINAKVPYADNSGKDALDLALICASYEQEVALFFHGDGVWQLAAQQQPELIQQKNYLKTFAAFELYDIEKVYVCQESLTERGLVNDFHIDDVIVLNKTEFYQTLASYNAVLRF